MTDPRLAPVIVMLKIAARSDDDLLQLNDRELLNLATAMLAEADALVDDYGDHQHGIY